MPTLYCVHRGCRCTSFISAQSHRQCANCQHDKIDHPEYPVTDSPHAEDFGSPNAPQSAVRQIPIPATENARICGATSDVDNGQGPRPIVDDVVLKPKPAAHISNSEAFGATADGRTQSPHAPSRETGRYEGLHQGLPAAKIACQLVMVNGTLQCAEQRPHVPPDLSVAHFVVRTVV
jgi:hypothetical protein